MTRAFLLGTWALLGLLCLAGALVPTMSLQNEPRTLVPIVVLVAAPALVLATLIAEMRAPAVLATSAAPVDRAARGRLSFALGTFHFVACAAALYAIRDAVPLSVYVRIALADAPSRFVLWALCVGIAYLVLDPPLLGAGARRGRILARATVLGLALGLVVLPLRWILAGEPMLALAGLPYFAIFGAPVGALFGLAFATIDLALAGVATLAATPSRPSAPSR